MIVLGLTGGAGSGKSAVAEMLAKKGAIILSGDDAGREAVERSPRVRRKIRQAFGDEVFRPDGTLDRARVGKIVFGDPEQMQKLNAIVHPPLLKILKFGINKFKKVPGNRLIVIDAALIFEWCVADWFDYILVVTAPQSTRISRLMKKGLPRKDAAARIRSQIPDRDKIALADYVIENNSTKLALRKKVEQFLKILSHANPA